MQKEKAKNIIPLNNFCEHTHKINSVGFTQSNNAFDVRFNVEVCERHSYKSHFGKSVMFKE